MEPIKKIGKIAKRPEKKNRYLHSPNHLLADELSVKLNDTKHFGFYLKMATLYSHDQLRRLMGEILENKNVKTPGRLFAYLIKKQNEEAAGSRNQEAGIKPNLGSKPKILKA